SRASCLPTITRGFSLRTYQPSCASRARSTWVDRRGGSSWRPRNGPTNRKPPPSAMKPNNANGKLSPAARPFRVLLIACSQRRQYDCPGIDSKARSLMFRLADRLPQDWEIDVEDLGNVWNREQ